MTNRTKAPKETIDRVLVTNIKTTRDPVQVQRMKHQLYSRYSRLVHKHWHGLTKQMNSSPAVLRMKEDFYSESYETFNKALNAVSLDKIKNDQWKFLGYFGFYLSATRNRYARNIVKQYKNETPIEIKTPNTADRSVYLPDLSHEGTSRSAEDEAIAKDEKKRFWKALKKCQTEIWTEEQNQIFRLRSKKTSVKNICAEVGMSSWKYNKLLRLMKESLDKEIELA